MAVSHKDWELQNSRYWKRSRFCDLDRHPDRSCCNSCPQKSYKQRTWKNWLVPGHTKRKNQYTFTRKQVEKTNKRWLIEVLPKKLRAKIKSKLRNFCRSRHQKTLNTRLRAIWMRGRNFVSHWKSLEKLKRYLPMSSTFFCPIFSPSFVNKMALSTNRVL